MLCRVVCPALVWAAAQLAPGHGEGVQLRQHGRVVGFANVGQQFSRTDYFSTRPSAVDYSTQGSNGSNQGPGNPEYLAQVEDPGSIRWCCETPAYAPPTCPPGYLRPAARTPTRTARPRGARVRVARVARARLAALVQANTTGGVLAPKW